MLVVDASAALYALTARDILSELGSHDPVAPPLLWSEVTSVLRGGVYRGTMSQQLATVAAERLLSGAIARITRDDLYREARLVAEQLWWAKTYDAEYVALARLLACPLLTVDARLQRGAGQIVKTLGPADL